MPLDYETRSRPKHARQAWHNLFYLITGAAFVAILVWLEVNASQSRSLGKARETRNRERCIWNLRSVGSALQRYANDNHDFLPPSLLVLATDQQLATEWFACPSSNAEPLNSTTMPVEPGPQQLFADSHQYRSYDYALPAGTNCTLSSLPPDAVLVVELLDNHDNEGVHVLFAGGTVDWVPADQTAAARGMTAGKAGQLLNDLKAGVWPLRVK